MSSYAIEARGLFKTFPLSVTAVAGTDLTVPVGEVFGLIGRNGAGKSTLIRLLLGLLRPTAGDGRVLGQDMLTADATHRARVAYVAQVGDLPPQLCLAQLCGWLAGYYPKWDEAYAQRLLRKFDLAPNRPCGAFSGGQQRKAAMLLAFASRCELILMDEPAAGLDPMARRELIELMIDTISEGDGATLLLSTHIISDLERIAQTVGIMDRGRIVRQARLSDLQSRLRRVQVVFDGPSAPSGFAVPGALRSQVEGPVVTAVVDVVSPTQLDVVRKMPGARLQEFPLGLEDIFIELYGRDVPEGDMQ